MTTDTGYVYLLVNPSFGEWVKIGTGNAAEETLQVANTMVPTPFTVVARMQTAKYQEVERLLLSTIDMLSAGKAPNPTFFKMPLQDVLNLFERIAPTIEDAQLTVSENAQEIIEQMKAEQKPTRSRRGQKSAGSRDRKTNFRFSMVGIKEGDKLVFEPTKETVVVKSDNTILYKDETYRLSGFCKKFMPKDQEISSGIYQGTKYFSFNGELLSKLRDEAESAS